MPVDIDRNDLVQAVDNVWQTALGLPATPDDSPAADGRPTVTGTVTIRGECHAEVVLRCDADLARQAAATFFALPEGELTDEMIHDAVGELANMTGGQLKSLLPEGCSLSPPVTRDTPPTDAPPGGTGFRAAERAFSVEVCNRDT